MERDEETRTGIPEAVREAASRGREALRAALRRSRAVLRLGRTRLRRTRADLPRTLAGLRRTLADLRRSRIPPRRARAVLRLARARSRRRAPPRADLIRWGFIAVFVLLAVALLSWPWFEGRMIASFQRADRQAATRVYARPIALMTGERVDAAQLEAYLQAADYRRAPEAIGPEASRPGQYRATGREWWIHRRPSRLPGSVEPGGLVRARLDRRGRVADLRDGDGASLEAALLEPPPLATLAGSKGRDRIPIRLDEVPDHLVDAVLAIEDRRFRRHGGLDLRRIGGAAVANLRAGRITQGGSTLTQQLARTLFLTRERTLPRKLAEAAVAVALERRFSKDEILEAYLDHIYLGHVDGVAIHGVGRAARHYFGVDASQLDLAQSALLAGLIRAPNLYTPERDTAAARRRRDLVLGEMARAGRLDDERLATALARPVRTPPSPTPSPIAPYFVDHLRGELSASLPPDTDLETAGLVVVSSLRPGLQRAAEGAVRRGLERLERALSGLARREAPLQAALVALDPRTGEILALVGGRDYAASEFNRAVDARRQPGSAFKPVVALAALTREADRYTLASLLEDEPLSVGTPAGPWRPANYDGWFEGQVTLRRALEESRNVPFARLGLDLGPERIVETARALGIRSELRAVPSLALGSSEVSVLELTAAYGVLAAGGLRAPPRALWGVLDATGRRVDEGPEPATRAFGPAEAYLVTAALEGVVERGTGRAVRGHDYYGPVAAKSGTTNDYRDAWFVGYTPELAVGVWVGFDDGSSVGRPGASAALPIFTDFLRAALGPSGGSDFRVPDGVKVAWVDPWGGRHGWGCYPEREVFLEGTVPTNVCGGWRVGRAGRAPGRWADRELDRWLERQAGRWAERASTALSDVERWLRERLEPRLPETDEAGDGVRR